MVDITGIDAFIQSSPHPAWLATSKGDCLYAIPALERLTGFTSDQINQADWRSFVVEEDPRAEARVSGPSGAAAKLGIPPSTLDNKIKAMKINKRRFKFG